MQSYSSTSILVTGQGTFKQFHEVVLGHFPPNTRPVSAIYNITTDLSIEATLELEHCYSGNHQDLAFVYSQSHQPPFDLVFAAKEVYTSSFTDTHGVVKTSKHMPSCSCWTIVLSLVDHDDDDCGGGDNGGDDIGGGGDDGGGGVLASINFMLCMQ